MNNEMKNKRKFRHDTTRLNTLLKEYRNHIIDVHHKQVPRYQISETVTLIDNAIVNIQIGINKL